MRALFELGGPIPEHEWTQFAAALEPRVLPAGSRLTVAGTRATEMAVLCRGVLIYVSVDATSSDAVHGIRVPGELAGSLPDLIRGRRGMAARASVVAAVTCELLVIAYNAWLALDSPLWRDIRLHIAEHYALVLDEQLEVLRLGDAEQRWDWLRSKRPDWLELVPQRHLASFLQMTPETLSRVRARKRGRRGAAVTPAREPRRRTRSGE